MIILADLPFTFTLTPPVYPVQTSSVAVTCVDQDDATFVFPGVLDDDEWVAELNLPAGRYKVAVAGYYNDAPSWRLPWQLVTAVNGDGT